MLYIVRKTQETNEKANIALVCFPLAYSELRKKNDGLVETMLIVDKTSQMDLKTITTLVCWLPTYLNW